MKKKFRAEPGKGVTSSTDVSDAFKDALENLLYQEYQNISFDEDYDADRVADSVITHLDVLKEEWEEDNEEQYPRSWKSIARNYVHDHFDDYEWSL